MPPMLRSTVRIPAANFTRHLCRAFESYVRIPAIEKFHTDFGGAPKLDGDLRSAIFVASDRDGRHQRSTPEASSAPTEYAGFGAIHSFALIDAVSAGM